MRLLVDIGNTHLKWAFLEGGELRGGGKLSHAGGFPQELAAQWLTIPIPRAVWAANVAGTAVADALSAWSEEHWGLTPRFVASQREFLGVHNGYRDYQRLGVDRWLALIAAHQLQGGAVLVVDCGTAATLDLVAADGRHWGGLILPGLGLMQSALRGGTRLAADPVAEEPPALGEDTATCIAAGARQALLGAIERTLAHAERALGARPALLLTGGDAARLSPHLAARLEPTLVLQGLALLAQGD